MAPAAVRVPIAVPLNGVGGSRQGVQSNTIA